jgi:hypothetical protein
VAGKRYSIYILGGQASGKSCFLAGLGVLSAPDRATGIQFSCDGEDLRKVRDLSKSLLAGTWPPSTTQGHFFAGELRFRGYDIPVDWIDYSGERFVRHFSEGDPQLEDLPDDRLREADFFLLAIDPAVVLAGEHAFSARDDLMKYKDQISAVSKALSDFRRWRGNEHPLHVAALITKADSIDRDLTTPHAAESYAREKAPAFFDNLVEQFPGMRVFAASAVGTTVANDHGDQVPAPSPEPWGYQAVFDWVVQTVRRKRRLRMLRRMAPFVGLVFIGLLSWGGVTLYQRQMANDRLGRVSTLPLPTPGSNPGSAPVGGDLEANWKNASDAARAAFVDRVIVEVQGVLQDPHGQIGDFERAIGMADAISVTGYGYRAQEIDAIRYQARTRIEAARFEAIQRAYDNHDGSLIGLALDYLKKYPSGSHRFEVSDLINKRNHSLLVQDVANLAAMGTCDTQGLRNVAQGLTALASNHPDLDGRSIRKAAGFAIALADQADRGDLRLELRSLGQLGTPAIIGLRIDVDAHSSVYSQQSPEKVSVYGFEGQKTLDMPWKPCDPIVLEALVRKGWILQNDETIASIRLSGPLGIAKLDGKLAFVATPNAAEYLADSPLILHADIAGWDSDAWKLLENWVTEKTALKALAESPR